MLTKLQIPSTARLILHASADDVVAAGGSLISRVKRDASSSRRESHGGGERGWRETTPRVGYGEKMRNVAGGPAGLMDILTYLLACVIIRRPACVRACVRYLVPCVVITGR